MRPIISWFFVGLINALSLAATPVFLFSLYITPFSSPAINIFAFISIFYSGIISIVVPSLLFSVPKHCRNYAVYVKKLTILLMVNAILSVVYIFSKVNLELDSPTLATGLGFLNCLTSSLMFTIIITLSIFISSLAVMYLSRVLFAHWSYIIIPKDD